MLWVCTSVLVWFGGVCSLTQWARTRHGVLPPPDTMCFGLSAWAPRVPLSPLVHVHVVVDQADMLRYRHEGPSKVGNHLDAGNRNVFVFLGRHMLGGKQEVVGEVSSHISV